MSQADLDAMRAATCRHFTGIQRTTCEAGVVLITVRDASQPGAYRWPCVTQPGHESVTSRCPRYEPQTAEEQAAEDAWVDDAVAKFNAAVKRDQDCT